MSVLLERWIGYGAPAKERYGIGDRLLAFVDIGRPVVAAMSVLGVGGSAILAFGGFPSLGLCLAGILAVFLAVWSVHTLNDYFHRKEDYEVWPRRPIPSGRITPVQGLVFGLICYAGALAVSWLFFSQASHRNFVILLMGLAASLFYSTYARDRIGYLSLPFMVGLFSLGGWTALSPQTLFTSPVPWLLYAIHFTWQASHILVHSVAHHPGALDKKGKTQKPAFFFHFTLGTSMVLATAFLFIFISLVIVLFFLTDLGLIYLVITLAFCAYTFKSVLAFLKEPTNRQLGSRAFNRLTLLRLGFSAAIVVNFILWGVWK